MTSAIESGSFIAKCGSGKKYKVIEKTKETNEPSTHYKQVFVTIQKSYFLSTGEAVNKLSDKHYLIVKNQIIISRTEAIINKPTIADIKSIFDYLKNQALCIAIMLAIPELTKVLFKAYNNPALTINSICIAFGAATVFSIYNLIGLFSSLEDKPKLKPLDIIVILFILGFNAAVMWLAILKALQGIDIDTISFRPT
ncbi:MULTISPECIES: hypothetical protein [Pseudomonas]|uniref:Uncharacterized protein n=1 Tax=Pseudomonas azadiae TaxID=2843612 RepID=A0ABS6NWY6_9PSED|nr:MULTISPECIES: hypothetical protein [Pseudomonas]MBV4452727.1 hypothetical protein [Pseudomonas azadiae]NMF42453.1 hypothetical protein [Pseudomonas sp. SWRI 103]